MAEISCCCLVSNINGIGAASHLHRPTPINRACCVNLMRAYPVKLVEVAL